MFGRSRAKLWEYDGSLQSAFRIIAVTRKQLEQGAEVERLGELYDHLGIIRDTVYVSRIRAESSRNRQRRLEEAVLSE